MIGAFTSGLVDRDLKATCICQNCSLHSSFPPIFDPDGAPDLRGPERQLFFLPRFLTGSTDPTFHKARESGSPRDTSGRLLRPARAISGAGVSQGICHEIGLD